MLEIDSKIQIVNTAICKNIDKFDLAERGEASQNILSHLRTFIEHISLKIYGNGQDIKNTYENIEKANAYVKQRGDLRFLRKLHNYLQKSASHYTLDPENSERLMLKYYEYLLKIKSYLKTTYDMDVLENINAFPINTDTVLREYYEKIAAQINKPIYLRANNTAYSDPYYIQKIKPFFVDNRVYYEVTFTRASDKVSKFDRIIAFTKCDISLNYATKFLVSDSDIKILGKRMPIQIIDECEVAIRPCEFNNFARIFNLNISVERSHKEYRNLMKYLTESGLNLVDIIDFNEDDYQKIRRTLTKTIKRPRLFAILDLCREKTKTNLPGSNVVRYLLYGLTNMVIKSQLYFESCDKLSNLHLTYKCIPFDEMPFNSSLRNHNPRLADLFDCIDSTYREHEIFARLIHNNTEFNGHLYSPEKEITNFENIDELIQRYNSALYWKHQNRRIEKYKDQIFISGYEKDTHEILTKLKELSVNGIEGYSDSVNAWMQSSTYLIDCDEKKNALIKMFKDSRVALIYGSAGTGKSTLINHISNYYKDENKLYLANTNPAVDNLRRKVKAENCTFKTITKFVKSSSNPEYDLLFIDECSTVSNSDMLGVLTKATYKLLILVGDVFQIESILFGNWFNVAHAVIPKSAVTELEKPYRTSNSDLLTLWRKVRKIDDDILEHIAKNGFSVTLDESIFERSADDEIILCLNYDGLYGINNINRFLQISNNNNPVQWGVHIYKVGDPILFNETNRFAPLIYNNIKGKIVGIEASDDQIQFDIEVDMAIDESEADSVGLFLVDNIADNNSVIRFIVNKHRSTDEDDDGSSDTVVPFQIAYAVSIHKAQGLEYDSVKIVITDEVEEKITHNILYTAITRAKNKLRIYWTPETESKILKGLVHKFNHKDVALLKEKFNL